MTCTLFTIHLRNDVTGETQEMDITAASRRDAEEIAASRTSWEWVIDRIDQVL